MKTKEMIKLQKEWYKKLEDTGFEDIETFDAQMEPHDTLKRSTITHALHIKDRYIEQEAYYVYAGRLLHSGLIPEKDLEIWALFCEGHSHRKIVKLQPRSHNGVYLSLKRTKRLLEQYIREAIEEEEDGTGYTSTNIGE